MEYTDNEIEFYNIDTALPKARQWTKQKLNTKLKPIKTMKSLVTLTSLHLRVFKSPNVYSKERF